MTNPAQDSNTSPDHTLEKVTLPRVIAAMKHFDIELTTAPGQYQLATANLNGFAVLFAVLESVVIVRADVVTSVSYANADAGLFLAAGSVNNNNFGARAVITEREDELIVRTEREFNCAAGMTDEQLRSALKIAVDGVLRTQDAMFKAAQEITDRAPDNGDN